MYKDPKLNKSPIDSILQQSFSQLSNQSKEKQRESKMFEHNREQFKFVKESNNINMQQQLKLVQLISMTQLEIALESIVNLLRNKVLNSQNVAIRKIKRADFNKNVSNNINKSDKVIVAKRISLLYQKISSTVNVRKLRILGISFNQIYLYSLKAPLVQKSSSNISPYRDHSKIENSDRVQSEWQLAQSQGGMDSYEQLMRENKFLKKKKEKMKACRQDFCNKIDEVLAAHEAFLSRK